MIDVLAVTAGALAVMWLVAIFGAPALAKKRLAECEALGLTSAAYVRAFRVRATLNVFTILIVAFAGWAWGPFAGVDHLLGGAMGLIAAVPIAYSVFAVANRTIAPGFNDTFVAVRSSVRLTRRGGR